MPSVPPIVDEAMAGYRSSSRAGFSAVTRARRRMLSTARDLGPLLAGIGDAMD